MNILTRLAITCMLLAAVSYSEMKLTKDVTWGEIKTTYKIETPSATYYYDYEGAGFSGLVDSDGKDWIKFKASSNKQKDHGIPNMGLSDYGHPGYPVIGKGQGGKTTVTYEGDDRISFTSESDDKKWLAHWDIYPTHATQTIEKIPLPTGFWWLYEGHPGGDAADLNSDYWVVSTGQSGVLSKDWNSDIKGDEWFFYVDPKVKRSLLMMKHEPVDAVVLLEYYRKDFAAGGWGRAWKSGIDKSKFIKTPGPHVFSFGLFEDTTREAISKVFSTIKAGKPVNMSNRFAHNALHQTDSRIHIRTIGNKTFAIDAPDGIDAVRLHALDGSLISYRTAPAANTFSFSAATLANRVILCRIICGTKIINRQVHVY